MKNTPLNMTDKILLRKRALVESVNDELKNIFQIEHSRHRSFINFRCNRQKRLLIRQDFIDYLDFSFCFQAGMRSQFCFQIGENTFNTVGSI